MNYLFSLLKVHTPGIQLTWPGELSVYTSPMFVNGTQFSKIFLDDFSLLTHRDPGLVVQDRVTFPPQKEPERTTLSLE